MQHTSAAQQTSLPVPFSSDGMRSVGAAIKGLIDLQQKMEVLFHRIEKKLEKEEDRATRVLERVHRCETRVRAIQGDAEGLPLTLLSSRVYPEEAAAQLLLDGKGVSLGAYDWSPCVADPKLDSTHPLGEEDGSVSSDDSEEEEEYHFLHHQGTLNNYQLDYFTSRQEGFDKDRRPRPPPVLNSKRVERRTGRRLTEDLQSSETIERNVENEYIRPLCRVEPPPALQPNKENTTNPNVAALRRLYEDRAVSCPRHPLVLPLETQLPYTVSEDPSPHPHTGIPHTALGPLPAEELTSVTSLLLFNQSASKGGLLYGLRSRQTERGPAAPVEVPTAEKGLHLLEGRLPARGEGYGFAPAQEEGAAGGEGDFIADLPVDLPGLGRVAEVGWVAAADQTEDSTQHTFLGPFPRGASSVPRSDVSSLHRSRQERAASRRSAANNNNSVGKGITISGSAPPPPPPPPTELLPPPPLPEPVKKGPYIPTGGQPSIISVMMGRTHVGGTTEKAEETVADEEEAAPPGNAFAAQLLQELQAKRNQLTRMTTKGDESFSNVNTNNEKHNSHNYNYTTLTSNLANRRTVQKDTDEEEDSSDEESPIKRKPITNNTSKTLPVKAPPLPPPVAPPPGGVPPPPPPPPRK
ncbi:hypothetical protein, conserved [Angomonas deanei]|uniref:WASH1 WAHD domain-containing protein n=1 Tax=Angomonas deanei TaxID=59799 RepID=A0A7G2CNW0_9TRYP|nr:hypothetical protein, conserved [Angomonas deanei]